MHLHRIHNAIGAPRLVHDIIERLETLGRDELRLLVDRRDVLPMVGPPWTDRRHLDSALDISWRQALRITADPLVPSRRRSHIPAESYVPTKRARIVVTLHDATHFEPSALPHDANFSGQKARWQVSYGKVKRKAELFHTVSQFSADRIAHFHPATRDRLRLVHNEVTDHLFQPPNAACEGELASLGLSGRPFILPSGGLFDRENAPCHAGRLAPAEDAVPGPVAGRAEALRPGIYRAVDRTVDPDAGYVGDNALCFLYHPARLFWFPSCMRASGYPQSKKRLAARRSSIPEAAGDEGLLVDPAALDRHVEALDGLLADDAARATLGAHRRERGRRFGSCCVRPSDRIGLSQSMPVKFRSRLPRNRDTSLDMQGAAKFA